MSIDRPSETDARPATVATTDPAHARLATLAAQLRGQHLSTSLRRNGLTVRNIEAPGCCEDNPVLSDTITCRPFDRDGGHLWFFTSSGDPIIEADRIADAVVRIKDSLTPKQQADR
ncbi:hypothetical protein GCM10009678_29020 [Actinomadura kijaniata]|uniref:Uncharacterized protein n=1 Tax=Actinomadura namibiensis TaxID=182080 RepID=A0A7W3LJX8_ACTNM|nr:hypothetical protein [Actinomadura namibiensis]MBA8949505.1 hypothetical protein [Actinomadura namibiensis]